jgi:hypothetical protein
MIQVLASNPWLTVAANILGVASFVLGFIFYFRAKERFALTYLVSERTLIHSSTERPFDLNLALSWNGRPLPQLTRSYVLIRNTGNKLIEREDIVGQPSVRVGAEIIDACIECSDDPGTQAQIVPVGDKRSGELNLEFLRPSDAIIIRIDHTGLVREIFVECHTKAGGPIKKNPAEPGFFIAAGSLAGLTLFAGFAEILSVMSSDSQEHTVVNILPRFISGAVTGFVAWLALASLILAVLSLAGSFIYKKRPVDQAWKKIITDRRR